MFVSCVVNMVMAQKNYFVHLFIRPLLVRELDSWRDILSMFEGVALVPDLPDRLIWIHDRARIFSVRKLSELMLNDGVEDLAFNFNNVWSLFVPPKVRSFLWMLYLKRIPTIDFLLKRGISIEESKRDCP
ncbi:hypothetical protein V6N13_012935 [Hibiscus sabdariffa]